LASIGTAPATATTYTDGSAEPSTTYYYDVAAFDIYGLYGPSSSTVSATTPAEPPPAVVSVTPNPASGLSNTFALTYSDVAGASDLKLVEVVFNSAVDAPNSCFVEYAPAANLLYLLNNAGTGSSSITPGSGTLSNSQCTITGNGTSVVKSGNNLTLNLDVTASSTFTGKHSLFMFAEDSSEMSSWVNEGTWTPAANQPPALVSVSPNPASGLSETFALTYSDPNGASDLGVVEVDFGQRIEFLFCAVLPGHQFPRAADQRGRGVVQDNSGFRDALQQSVHHHGKRHNGGEVGRRSYSQPGRDRQLHLHR
jgi:hypothetical protein